MSKSARKPRARSPQGWAAVKPFVASLVTLAVVVFALLGLRELGRRAGQNIGERERYEVPFAKIDTPAPPGLTREAFLAEVRAASGMVESFQLLDPTLAARLKPAFEAHPWVESFESVAVEPPETVRVSLRFRTPVLVVRGEKESRVLDGHGILLPPAAPADGAAILANRVTTAPPKSGEPWLDPLVTRAVELASVYRPTRIERTDSGWKLAMPDGKDLRVEK